jgi:lysophospholipase L1-like esterase
VGTERPEGQLVSNRLKLTLFKLAPTAILIAVFLLGFLGKPEDSSWLNSSQLWHKGDPFFWGEGSRYLASPYFLYRGKPHATGKWPYYGVSNQYVHNELGLRDDPIVDPKPDGVFRILNFGDSATWGLSLPGRKHTYSDRLEEMLNGDTDDPDRQSYDVINAGTVGYSSWQALRWLEFYIDELKPDAVTVFIGNNDSAPSGSSDAKRGSVPFSSVTRILSHNAFYLLLQKAWLSLRERRRDEKREEFLTSVSSQKRSVTKDQWYDSAARVSPRDYESNLRALIEIARKNDTRVILLKVPMNFVWPQNVIPNRRSVFNREYWYPIFVAKNYLAKGLSKRPPCDTPLLAHPWLCKLSVEQVNAYLVKQGRYRDAEHFVTEKELLLAQPGFDLLENPSIIYQLAMVHIAQERYAKAEPLLRSLIEANDFDSDGVVPAQVRSDIHYALGVSLLLDGRREEARSAFVRSRKVFPFAMSFEYHDAFDRVVKELEVESIGLPYLFEQSDPDYFGSSLMHDWVHPSPEGNQIIAEALAAQITQQPTR